MAGQFVHRHPEMITHGHIDVTLDDLAVALPRS
jgi:hypothetical protein